MNAAEQANRCSAVLLGFPRSSRGDVERVSWELLKGIDGAVALVVLRGVVMTVVLVVVVRVVVVLVVVE